MFPLPLKSPEKPETVSAGNTELLSDGSHHLTGRGPALDPRRTFHPGTPIKRLPPLNSARGTAFPLTPLLRQT